MPHLVTQDAKDEAARRRIIYDDVEALLSPGFLSQAATVAGIRVSMKTLFPGEMFLLRNRIGADFSERVWRAWAVASAVWMLDGQVLLDDANAATQLYPTLINMPKPALDVLFSSFTNLHNRVQKALARLEAYCYEDYGRAYWRMVGRASPSRDEVAGVPGVSSLGMNHLQRLWVAFNLAEDDRQTWDLEWAAAKLIASASSPKGVKQLNSRDESSRKLEQERRKGVLHKTYYNATGHQVGETGGVVVYRSVTPEELVDEMERYARGERDWHDQIVESYKNNIRQKHDEDKERHARRMQEIAALREGAGTAGSHVVGYTLEQVRDIQRSSGGTGKRIPGRVHLMGDSSRVYDKYLSRDVSVGGLTDGGRARPLQDAGAQTLSEVVSNRKVTLSTS